jgi:hypothetical protein
MTSAGELDGGAFDWFFELVEGNEAEPHPAAYVYVDPEAKAAFVAKSTVTAVSEFFGKAESLKTFVEIEVHGNPRRKGEDFLTDQEQKRVEDKNLTNRDRGDGPCVAFLDTSVTTELTSLVIVGDDSHEGEDEWNRIAMWRTDVWDPRKRGGINEQEIEDHLDLFIPIFMPLLFGIDTRRMPWAIKLLNRCKKKPWRRIVEDTNGWRLAVRRMAWSKLENYIIGERARIFARGSGPVGKILCKELKAARRLEDLDGNIDIREQSRKKRHLDIAEGLASCCYLIHKLQAKPKRARRSNVKNLLNTAQPLVPGSTLKHRSRLTPSGNDW